MPAFTVRLTKHDYWLIYHYPRAYLCTRLAAIILLALAFLFIGQVLWLMLNLFSVLVSRSSGNLSLRTLTDMAFGYLAGCCTAAFLLRVVYSLWMFRLWAWWVSLIGSGLMFFLSSDPASKSPHLNWVAGSSLVLFILLLLSYPIFSARAADT